MPQHPFVSVIMPVRNEADFIERSLGSVLNQDYPKDRMEVIIADGCSTDSTREIVDSLMSGDNILLLDNHDKTASSGLNIATKIANGEIIVRVDGHCEIEPHYIRRCVDYITSCDVDGVGGPVETVGSSLISNSIACAMSSRFGVGNSTFRTEKGTKEEVDTIPFPAYSRRIIEKAGPYDQTLVRNQDDEYNYRIRKIGGKLLFASDISSRYYSRSSLTSLWSQYLQYGFWKVRVLQKHPRQMKSRQFVPPAFVLTFLILLIASLFSSIALYTFASLVGVYTLTNITFSTLIASRRPNTSLWLLPLCFAILHFSYGIGFLVGSVYFAKNWFIRSSGENQ
jgi:succinoglycan biosynthesis protein ExoA